MNRELAENRLVSLEKRLERTPVLEKRYKETISQHISKGYARKLSQNEIRNTSDVTNFISHHCVFNPKKPDKVRAVFDTGVKFKGVSLNDNLLKGPDLLNSLITILICFRLGKYAVIADIEQMFHQLRVRQNDQHALRFLWRTSKFENPVDYVVTVHLFSKNDSPCVTNYGFKKCTMDLSNNFDAKTVECVEKDFCMDDFLKRLRTIFANIVKRTNGNAFELQFSFNKVT